MACRQAGANPLSKPMLEYGSFDPWEWNSLTQMHMKMSSAKWRPFCLDLNELTNI